MTQSAMAEEFVRKRTDQASVWEAGKKRTGQAFIQKAGRGRRRWGGGHGETMIAKLLRREIQELEPQIHLCDWHLNGQSLERAKWGGGASVNQEGGS